MTYRVNINNVKMHTVCEILNVKWLCVNVAETLCSYVFDCLKLLCNRKKMQKMALSNF